MRSIKCILSMCVMIWFVSNQIYAQQIELRYLGVTHNTAVYSSQQMMSVQITSSADNVRDVVVEFVVHNDQQELLAHLKSDVFRIGANQTITGPRFRGMSGSFNQVFARPSFNQISRANFNFPTGSYKICAYVKTVEGALLGQACYMVNIQSPLALHLIYPFDEQIVEEDLPVFSWTPIFLGAKESVSYRIRWVQSTGTLSKADFNQGPAFFIQEHVRSSYLPYSTSFEKFDHSKTYYWKVQAVSNNQVVTESDVWEFKFETSRKPKNENGPFAKLGKDTKNNVLYVSGKQLHIEIDNPFSHVDIKYAINGLQATPVLSGVWQAGKDAQSGKNYKSIDLNDKIIPGHPYLLSVNMAGELLELFFVKN